MAYCIAFSNCSLLGDKSPFSQQNIQGDAIDRDEETGRIQCQYSHFLFHDYMFNYAVAYGVNSIFVSLANRITWMFV